MLEFFSTMKIVLPKYVYRFLKNILYFCVEQIFKKGEIHFGIGRNYSENNNVRGDLYTKHLVENIVSDRVKKYDPYIMDETTVYTKVANLEFGKITLQKGLLTGLSTLHPTTICTLNESEGKLEINTNLGAGPLQYQGETLIGFGRYSRKAILSLCLLHIRIIMDFDINKETGRKGRLFNIFITEMKDFRLGLHGFGCLDLPINLVLKLLYTILKVPITIILENILYQYICDKLPNYQFPVEGSIISL